MDQLLTTKLYIPQTRPELVPRPRLLGLLNAGLCHNQGFGRKLTLISAPAGFGKTTLLAEWVKGLRLKVEGYPDNQHLTTLDIQPSIAWLSLDENDQDLTRFLIYFIAALQTADANFGKCALSVLQSSQPPQAETILTALINELADISGEIILVLDDYHDADARSVDDALAFLLEHLPPQVHLVIATREDPNLPLARLRALGQLLELRVADLRFTPEEAVTFLNQVMGLDLSSEDVNSLEIRTEGWIAGLQLAALSMRGRTDVHGFIQAFTGDNRYIVDYLVEEVLRRQPEDVRSFLLQTSILERLRGPLCEAVTGQAGGSLQLEALERGNLFVISLDDKRGWFRYHHLFADVLRANVLQEQPDQVPILHRRASEWYEQEGLSVEAIRHALAAQDCERAADLIELAWAEMDRSRQSARWLRWAKALPDELVRTRPVLSAGYAWALLDVGELEPAFARLRDAESWLMAIDEQDDRMAVPLAEMVVVDEEEYRHLPATIASARAYYALAFGDVSTTKNYSRRALDLLPEGDFHRRGIPAALLGLASWNSGDLEAADHSFSEAMRSFQMAGNILYAITGTYSLADMRLARGRLREAFAAYQQSLKLAEGQDELILRGTADLHSGLSELYCERNDLGNATRHLLRSKELGEHAALPRWHYRWHLAQARLKQAEGNLDEALTFLDKAKRLYVRGPVPEVRPIAAYKARIWVYQGQLAEAYEWVRERGLSVEDDLSYLCEYDHITLARVLIAQYKSDRVEHSLHEAIGLLERLLKAAQEGRRLGSVLEILMVQALAHEGAKQPAPGSCILGARPDPGRAGGLCPYIY